MRIGYRNVAPGYPFLWADASQPPARWHGAGEGPAHYFADTPDGAWAEFVRHEELTDAEDLEGVSRSLWAVEIPDRDIEEATPLALPADTSELGYPACQDEARRARQASASCITSSSAALADAGGLRCESGVMVTGDPREASVWVLFGDRSDLVGWLCVEGGAPPSHLVGKATPLI